MEELEEQRNEFRDMLQRKQAEFENYRKRTLKERTDLRIAARAEVFRQLLPVLDASEKGLQSMGQGGDNPDPLLESYREGYRLLVKEIHAVFDRFEVEAVPGPGQLFDPNLHEAVLREETDQGEDGTILEEFRKGFQYRDLLLRPSQVKVAVRADPPSGADGSENESEAAAAQQEPANTGGGSSVGENGKVDIQA